jgi:hypothetical protein
MHKTDEPPIQMIEHFTDQRYDSESLQAVKNFLNRNVRQYLKNERLGILIEESATVNSLDPDMILMVISTFSGGEKLIANEIHPGSRTVHQLSASMTESRVPSLMRLIHPSLDPRYFTRILIRPTSFGFGIGENTESSFWD